jgi:geranylgeranyl diphosphate synthase type II
MDFQLKNYLADKKAVIDAALKTYIHRFCLSERMFDPAWYCVEAGGKRLRPVLCMAACQALGRESQIALPAACALEMIHTYSLIHDDLPALDNDALRRGKPTCHVQFDEATAILAGDALLNMAFEVLADAGAQADTGTATIWWRVARIIATASGCRGMIEGQARDLAFEGQKLSRAELENLHRLKTGAMIQASVQSGAILAQADEQQMEHLTRYADCIGLAYQVIDDVLNVTGDPQLTGKAVGTDQARSKNTYPSLLGLESSKRYGLDLIDKALHSLSTFDTKADPLRAIAWYIVERNR